MIARILLPILILIVITSLSVFRVQQWEQAIVFQFREVKRVDNEPGLHAMIPLVNTVKKFPLRLLNLEQQPQRYLTAEKKDVIVDYYGKWRISNVQTFYTSTRGGDLDYANGLLGQRINSALRDEFGRRNVQEVVAGTRGEILDIITAATSQLEAELGIKIVDVRLKRIDLPEEVSSSVYDRMRAERLRVAKDFRARGEEAAERIQANADRERQVILAGAYRDAETIRGEGDAQATEIYASAFGKNEEFYGFYRRLGAYQATFSSGRDILVLKPDSDFFKYFGSPRGR
ncbi:MAG: HflC protein [Gammaproteobacteria bacterium RIFCSPLOWO2_02_FULL_61_13]|nr:MAG: HflC protein [Gammaproteobacteria bacterium RIFCSPLOWO2_02_FULL_61_13]